jgi:hypothetical protein
MQGFGWPENAQAAISLTYDGGLPEHLHLAHPILHILRLPATFYMSATYFLDNPRAWAKVAEQGNEIGNHSLFGVAGERGELPNWTIDMVQADLRDTETLLRDYVPDAEPRSFAYPGDMPMCADGSYEAVVEATFPFARTSQEGFNHAVFVNPCKLLSFRTEGRSGAGLVEIVEEAAELGAWLILATEQIGSSRHALAEQDQETLLRHLSTNRERFHLAPVREVGKIVVEKRRDMLIP